MTQLDLFSTAATPASQPKRADLPLLLAASVDHTLGGALPALPAKAIASALDVQPNQSGVYPDDLAERLTLPNPRKGAHVRPIAEIRLLHTGQGWLACYSYDTENSGGGMGLSPKWHGGFLPDRAAALNAMRQQLMRYLERNNDKSAARIRAWLPTLL